MVLGKYSQKTLNGKFIGKHFFTKSADDAVFNFFKNFGQNLANQLQIPRVFNNLQQQIQGGLNLQQVFRQLPQMFPGLMARQQMADRLAGVFAGGNPFNLRLPPRRSILWQNYNYNILMLSLLRLASMKDAEREHVLKILSKNNPPQAAAFYRDYVNRLLRIPGIGPLIQQNGNKVITDLAPNMLPLGPFAHPMLNFFALLRQLNQARMQEAMQRARQRVRGG
jgi:hypothetical protein